MEEYAWLRWLVRSCAFETPNDGGGDASTSQGTTSNQGGNTDAPNLGNVAQAFLRNQGSGDAVAAISQLLHENYTLREERRSLRTQLESAKKKHTPEDALVLTGDAAKAVKELGEKPAEELLKKLTRLDEVEKKLWTIERHGALREAASVANINGEVLVKHLPTLETEIEVSKEDGKDVKKAMVTIEENGSKRKEPLLDFLNKNHNELIPALQVTGSQNGQSQAQQAGGTGTGFSFARQESAQGQGGNAGGGGDIVGNYITNLNKQHAGRKEEESKAAT